MRIAKYAVRMLWLSIIYVSVALAVQCPCDPNSKPKFEKVLIIKPSLVSSLGFKNSFLIGTSALLFCKFCSLQFYFTHDTKETLFFFKFVFT